jgi:hypothetical protein
MTSWARLRVTEYNRKETKMESRDSRYLRIFQEISKTISTTLSVDERFRLLAASHTRL